MSGSFTKLNCLAAFVSMIIFAVMIAASTVDWYTYSETYILSDPATADGTEANSFGTLNFTRYYYNLEGVTTQTQPTGQTETSVFRGYDSNASSLFSVFKVAQAFVLVALITAFILGFFLILCFADAVRNKLLFWAGMNVLRIVLVLIAAVILISLCVAFLSFLGITEAFSNDTPSCNAGYCRRFQDSVKHEHGFMTQTSNGKTVSRPLTQKNEWGPTSGWYLTLACIPCAILVLLLVVINKFPIPVDSVTIGEAL